MSVFLKNNYFFRYIFNLKKIIKSEIILNSSIKKKFIYILLYKRELKFKLIIYLIKKYKKFYLIKNKVIK